jgi:serine/threonine protein kinase
MSEREIDHKLTEAWINDIVLRWQEARELDLDLAPAELCRDRPELVSEVERRIRALQLWDGLAQTEIAHDGCGASKHPPRTPSSAVITLDLADLTFHAQGGLGAVFRAHDHRLGRDLAVKFTGDANGMFAEEEIEQRFLREVSVTASLEHPGIVPVYGLGTDDEGRLCYAMRFITGKTLATAIAEYHKTRKTLSQNTRVPLRRDGEFRALLQRLKSACVTVAYAHSRGFLHRDLKPEHVLLGDFDVTLVVDWGLTKSWSDTEATPVPRGVIERDRLASDLRTETGIGTLGFASPEQQAGEWDRVGPASDVFSLGASLYVLLAGCPPFQGTTAAQVLAYVREGELIPPRKKNPAVPPPLEAICVKALAQAPEDRYPSAQDLADDIERWLADESVSAYTEPLSVRVRRSIDRHQILLFMLLAATVGGIGVATTDWHRARVRDIEVRSLAYVSAEKSVREQVLTRRPGWATESLRQLGRASQMSTPLRSEATLRSLAVACLSGVDLQPLGSVATIPAGCMAFSPEGRRLAVGELFGNDEYRVQIIDVDLGRTLQEHVISARGDADQRSGVSVLRYSPDGRWLAAGLRNGKVLVWDATADIAEARPAGRSGPDLGVVARTGLDRGSVDLGRFRPERARHERRRLACLVFRAVRGGYFRPHRPAIREVQQSDGDPDVDSGRSSCRFSGRTDPRCPQQLAADHRDRQSTFC